MRVLVVLLIAMLAGCATPYEDARQLTSSEALATAMAHAATVDPDAILISLSAETYDPQDPPKYFADRGFRTDLSDVDVTDGKAFAWQATFALFEGDGRLPGTLVLQITDQGVRADRSPGQVLVGAATGAGHHGDDDICFTSESTRETFEALDLLGELTLADAAAALSQIQAPKDFFATAEHRYLSLNGASSAYGTVGDGYWCYSREVSWRLGAWTGTQSYDARFTPGGELVRLLDWTEVPVGQQEITMSWPVTTGPLETARAQTRSVSFELAADAHTKHVTLEASGGQGVEDRTFQLTSPSGVVIEPRAALSRLAMFQLKDYEAGTWTATYSFTAGLPVGEHDLDARIAYYGPAPG